MALPDLMVYPDGDQMDHQSSSLSPLGHSPTCGDISATQIFQSITMVDVLEQDPRPAFVIDLEDKANASTLRPIFCNQSFKNIPGLIDVVIGQSPARPYGQSSYQTYSSFMKWAVNTTVDGPPQAFVYDGMSWTSMTINQRWRMVNAIKERQQGRSTGAFANASWGPKAVPLVQILDDHKDEVDGNNGNVPEADRKSTSARFLQEALGVLPKRSGYDWTATCPPPYASEHILLARSINWADTPLGLMSSWTSSLRHTVNQLMTTPTPAVVFWGPEFTILYNEAYTHIVAEKHPALFGKAAPQGFGEAWDMFQPFFRRCIDVGHGATFDDMQLFLDRGFWKREETYFTFSIAPVVGDDNEIAGWFEHVTETTKRKIGERRMATILEIGEMTSTAQDLKSFWKRLAISLEPNTHDVSFSLFYSVFEDVESHTGSDGSVSETSSTCTKRLQPEGSIGVPSGHPAAPQHVYGSNLIGLTSYFKEAHQGSEPLFLSVENGTLKSGLVEGLYSRGFGDPCESVVILEIIPTTGSSSKNDRVLGFIIMGLNTRRPYDEEYRQFTKVLQREITTSMASVLLLEEEIRRGRTIAEQAAIDQQIMEEKLQARTFELEGRNLQLKHFADCVPVGIFVVEFSPEYPNGQYAYRNDKLFELTGGSREEDHHLTPGNSPVWARIHEDDVREVRMKWNALLDSCSACTSFQFRVPRRRGMRFEDEGNAVWLLTYAFSVVDPSGSLKSIIGSVTDITAQKWAEDSQKRRMEDALESKRQQENFIDVTSHEMRNPLSAIMISADDIMSSLRSVEVYTPDAELKLDEVLKNSIDAAQVIADCAQHQKRIVDDILTISKLDSGLFSITPVEVQPVTVINTLLRMFDAEFTSADITQHLRIDASFDSLVVDHLLLDSSRLLQILINLVTNAIKFTKFADTRHITISLGAAASPPTRTIKGNDYLPHRKQREDLLARPEWGDGDAVYLKFAVEDTGRGLTPEEKEILFRRFSQAPKTHVNYGGSGLGLFISRELAEMQGGQISVASAGKHKGSEFSFYIKTRKALRFPSKPDACKRRFSVFQSEAQSAYAVRSAIDHEMDGNTTTLGRAISRPISIQNTCPKHALIVEDNIVNQKVLKKQLVKLGYEVSITNHGREAIDFLLTTTYAATPNPPKTATLLSSTPYSPISLSIVLLDSEMPVMDGLTAVRKIREMETQGIFVEHVPVIAITANARIEQVNAALEAGMDDVVAKPFRVPELVGQIERLTRALDEEKRKGERF